MFILEAILQKKELDVLMKGFEFKDKPFKILSY